MARRAGAAIDLGSTSVHLLVAGVVAQFAHDQARGARF